jgi:diguanylate cyclase (GGDEF)-like protein
MPSSAWATAEVLRDPLLYVYLAASTSVVFMIVGRALGRHVDDLQALATTDALTGLFNRRHFEIRLREELARWQRYRTPVSLLIFDVDGLKPINDQSGHEAGDAALRMVADALRATCRTTDVIARLGGDEFAVLAPLTHAAEAIDLAERVRSVVREMHSQWGRVTVSVGVADSQQSVAAHPEALLAAADQALYVAKAAGRDRSSLAPPSSERIYAH